MEIRNAVIRNTRLARDHAMLLAVLCLDFGDGTHTELVGRLVDDDATRFLANLMETVGVHEWRELDGKAVRLKSKDDCLEVGHIIYDIWLGVCKIRFGNNGAEEDSL